MNQYGVYLMGGLGNQIFQYLFALKLYERFGDRVFMFVDWFLSNQLLGRESNRPMLLHRIPGIKIPLSTLGLAAEDGTTFARVHRYEQDGGWEALHPEQDDNVLVIGYFQSADALPSAPEVAAFCVDLALEQAPTQPDIVAIHLRLGDYLKIQGTLPVLPLRYYEKALAAQAPDSRFVVFAENATEAQEFLQPLTSRYCFEFQPAADPVEDFRHLAAMPTIIGANSTFSYLSGLAASQRGARVWLPAAEYWHGPHYAMEIAGKRELLAYGDFQVIA